MADETFVIPLPKRRRHKIKNPLPKSSSDAEAERSLVHSEMPRYAKDKKRLSRGIRSFVPTFRCPIATKGGVEPSENPQRVKKEKPTGAQ